MSNKEEVIPSDLPCGCRFITSTTRLCAYHKGYAEGFIAGKEIGLVELANTLFPAKEKE